MNEDVNCYLPLPFYSELGILNSILRELPRKFEGIKGYFLYLTR